MNSYNIFPDCRIKLINVFIKLAVLVFLISILPPELFSADAEGNMVHDYGKSGDDPATIDVDESDIVASDDIVRNKQYQLSSKYEMATNGISISIYQYKKGYDSRKYHNFDIARFSVSDSTPQIQIKLIDGTDIKSVEIYPERYYPTEKLSISSDKSVLTFNMAENLPYCIVNVNGTLKDTAGIPMLAVIKDPPELEKPDINAENVLNFKTFATKYLQAHPIDDKEGRICRPAGVVTDTSRNSKELFTWRYEAGIYVDPQKKDVQFPDKRVRDRNDVSDAFQAALEKVRKSPRLDTIYFPAGTYIWSGLCIKNWNGNGADGKLNIYLGEDALLVNRIQECKQALEPAIGIWYSSNINISGRGIIDGNGCYTLQLDRKDARDTPHQGGAMLVHCSDITFNDTYVRDVKQWNWECHTVRNVTYNNIKGLSPFCHAWVDGLDLTSGRNVTVNGAFTLGNDDTFASGHYNPGDEFPRRFLDDLDRAKGDDKSKMEAMKSNICAAAAVYNKARLKWDTDDSEKIVVNNVLAWSGFANSVRLGANTRWKGEPGEYESYKLKSYILNNFHSVIRNAGSAVRAQNGSKKSYPCYEDLIFMNCSFAGNQAENVAIPVGNDFNGFTPRHVIFDNCWFADPARPFIFIDIKNLFLKDIYVGGQLLTDCNQASVSIKNVDRLIFTANGEEVIME